MKLVGKTFYLVKRGMFFQKANQADQVPGRKQQPVWEQLSSGLTSPAKATKAIKWDQIR